VVEDGDPQHDVVDASCHEVVDALQLDNLEQLGTAEGEDTAQVVVVDRDLLAVACMAVVDCMWLGEVPHRAEVVVLIQMGKQVLGRGRSDHLEVVVHLVLREGNLLVVDIQTL